MRSLHEDGMGEMASAVEHPTSRAARDRYMAPGFSQSRLKSLALGAIAVIT